MDRAHRAARSGSITPECPPATDSAPRASPCASRRQLVLGVARRLAVKIKRPFTMGEVIAAAHRDATTRHCDGEHIGRSVHSLVATRAIRVVERYRGGRRHNTQSYWPMDMPSAHEETGTATRRRLTPKLPFTERVWRAFLSCWNDEVTRARQSDEKPCPITTRSVRLRLSDGTDPAGGVTLTKCRPVDVVNAMQSLARANPVIRRVHKRKANSAVLWAPVDVTDDMLTMGSVFESETARVIHALQHVLDERAVPAVSRAEFAEFVAEHPVYAPRGKTPIAAQLSKLADPRTYGGKARGRQVVFHVGHVGKRVYYTCVNSSARTPIVLGEAVRYVALLEAERRCQQIVTTGEHIEATGAVIPAVRWARLSLLQAELTRFSKLADAGDVTRPAAARRTSGARGETLSPAFDSLLAAVEAELRDIRPLADTHVAVTDASSTGPGWTVEQLAPLMGTIQPLAARTHRLHQMALAYSMRLRRVPNPEYTARRNGPQALFDRFDALTRIALERGGTECLTQAVLARGELGALREPHFVVPALDSADLDTRLVALAACAFLQTDDALPKLRQLIVSDPEPGVRISALWAFGFMGSPEADGTARLVAKRDADASTRRTARRWATDGLSWWDR